MIERFPDSRCLYEEKFEGDRFYMDHSAERSNPSGRLKPCTMHLDFW
jgi:hypothetical protein